MHIKNHIRRPLITASVLLLSFVASAVNTRDYRFHRLPETSYYGGINSISKDAMGRIWFTGTDALYMFNGSSFQRVDIASPEPSIAMDFRFVTTRKDGTLLVASNVGLLRYDYRSQGFERLLNGEVSSIESDRDGVLWFLNDGVLVSLNGSGEFTRYGFDGGLKMENCHSVDDEVYVSRGSAAWRLDKESGRFSSWAELPSGPISDMLSHKGNVILLTEKNGLFACTADGTVTPLLPDAPETGGSSISKRLYKDKNGIVWIATQTGLRLWDPDTMETAILHSDLNDVFSLPNDSVWSVFEDTDGSVWIGTYGGKLAYQSFEDEDVIVVNPESGGLNHPVVSAFAEDAHGHLWIGTEGGGINCMDLSSGRIVDYSGTSSSKRELSMVKRLKCEGDMLYIATFHGGLLRMDTRSGAVSNVVPAHSSIYDFLLDGDKGVWLSNPDADLLYWNASRREFETVLGRMEDGSEMHLRVESMFLRGDRELFLSTRNGVVVIDPATRDVLATHRVDGGDIRSNFINCHCQTDASHIWFGTMGSGIFCLTPEGGCLPVKDARGNSLGHSRIFAMEPVGDGGDVWISTDSGIYLYDSSQDLFVQALKSQDNACGAYYLRSGFVTSDGRVVFGGTDGFISFHPGHINRNTHKPGVFFTGLSVNNEACGIGTEGSPLHQSIASLNTIFDPQAPVIRLKWNQTAIKISYSTDSYLDYAHNAYAYRMAGLSDKWITTPPGQQSVDFLDLPAGHYRFEIKAANNVGLWGDQVSSLSFVVKPSPLVSPLALLLYLILISLAVGQIWRYSTRRKVLEKQLQLEMEKEQSMREVERSRNEFFTNISHDLKTPLTLVMDPLRQLEEQIPQDAPYRKLVQMIQRNISRIQHMLMLLLQFRQIESAKPKMKETPGDIVKFVDSVFSLFEFYANRRKIETEFIPWTDSFETSFDADLIEKVFTNLFSNAVKYTTEDGYVGVRISPVSPEDAPQDSEAPDGSQWISFTVTNTGSEIPPSRYQTIFEPFNDEGKTRLEFESHTGLGLAIVQALVKDMHGSISVSSADMKVSFTVVLPFTPLTGDVRMPEPAWSEDDTYDYAASEIDAMINEIDDMDSEEENRDRKLYDILVIEDDAQLRGYLEQRLSIHYNVYTASNGNDGISKAGRIVPDIIITDLLMPGADGFEVCRTLRSDIKTSHIPIIALSATGENTNFKIEALESGANVFIDKPVRVDYLFKQVDILIKNQNSLKELYSRRFLVEPSNIASSSVDEELMRKAVGFVEQNFENENYGVEDFVSDMAIARTRLYQKINSLTGMSIKEFILDVRLKRAGQLLRETEYTVSEISTMTGFASPKYFSVCFKRHFGQSPTEFKANNDAK